MRVQLKVHVSLNHNVLGTVNVIHPWRTEKENIYAYALKTVREIERDSTEPSDSLAVGYTVHV